MATPKVLYAVRIPVDLKRLIDAAAASGGVSTSALVIAACWKYLDRTPHAVEQAQPIMVSAFNAATPAKMNDAMAKFMAQVVPVAPEPSMSDAAPMCPHKEWTDDGEQYACALPAGHKGKCKPGARI